MFVYPGSFAGGCPRNIEFCYLSVLIPIAEWETSHGSCLLCRHSVWLQVEVFVGLTHAPFASLEL